MMEEITISNKRRETDREKPLVLGFNITELDRI